MLTVLTIASFVRAGVNLSERIGSRKSREALLWAPIVSWKIAGILRPDVHFPGSNEGLHTTPTRQCSLAPQVAFGAAEIQKTT